MCLNNSQNQNQRLTKAHCAFRNTADFLAENWIVLTLTAGIINAAIYNLTQAEDWTWAPVATADVLSGYAAALAFLWLIAGYRLQTKELKEQRKAIELQSEELTRMAKFSALEHVRVLIQDAVKGLREHPVQVDGKRIVNGPDDLIIFVGGSAEWNVLFTSDNADEIVKLYVEFRHCRQVHDTFVQSYLETIRFYLESNKINDKLDVSNPDFLKENYDLLIKLPYIAPHLKCVERLIETENEEHIKISYQLMYAAGKQAVSNKYGDPTLADADIYNKLTEYQQQGYEIPVILQGYMNSHHSDEQLQTESTST